VLFPLTVAIVSGADEIAGFLKRLTGRERPYVDRPEPEPLMATGSDLAFPSGHATTSFAGAVLLAVLVPRLALPFFVLAAAIAWSRVYVGVHFPLDVAAGALLGAAAAFALRALLRPPAARPG
jgi:undecaprenyl-diphosphatase